MAWAIEILVLVLLWPTMLVHTFHIAWLSWTAELAWLGLLCFRVTRLLRRPRTH